LQLANGPRDPHLHKLPFAVAAFKYQVATRGIDHVRDLGGRGLPLQRLVALGGMTAF
jgi:hypothetical protein